jgi:hypothetical protein
MDTNGVRMTKRHMIKMAQIFGTIERTEQIDELSCRTCTFFLVRMEHESGQLELWPWEPSTDQARRGGAKFSC